MQGRGDSGLRKSRRNLLLIQSGAASETLPERAVPLFTLCWLGFMTLLAVSAWLVWASADAGLPDTSGLLAYSAAAISPEANERLAYVATVGAGTLALLAIGVAAKRFPSLVPDRSLMFGLIVLFLALLAPLTLVPSDPDRSALLPIREMPWAVAFLVVASVVAAQRGWVLFRSVTAHRVVVWASCAFAVVVSFGSMVAQLDTVGHSSGHFDAFFYSVVQIAQGGTCLSDVLPQYGCYGEFLAPVLGIAGPSVENATVMLALLQIGALVAVIYFAGQIISRPLVLLTASTLVIVLTSRVFYLSLSPDPYFQYWPLRLLFPALSLPLALWWIDGSPAKIRAVALGAFSGLGLWWNLDSGAVVAGALGAAVLFSRRYDNAISITGRLVHAALYAVGVTGAFLAFLVYLSVKSGGVIPIGDYLVYQQTFLGAGFYMLPLPVFPDPWIWFAAVSASVLFVFALYPAGGKNMDAVAYVAVLSIGALSYFIGRSHPVVFLTAAWPFALLIPAIVDQWVDVSSGRGLTRFPQSFIVVGLLVGVSPVLAQGMPRLYDLAVNRLSPTESHRSQHAEFIRSAIQPGSTVAILADESSILFSATGLRSAVNGPGMNEVLRRADAEAIVGQLVSEDGPTDLFIGAPLLQGEYQTWGSEPWVQQSLPAIEVVYKEIGRSADGEVIHLRRR